MYRRNGLRILLMALLLAAAGPLAVLAQQPQSDPYFSGNRTGPTPYAVPPYQPPAARRVPAAVQPLRQQHAMPAGPTAAPNGIHVSSLDRPRPSERLPQAASPGPEPAPPAPAPEVFAPSQIVAWVGDQPIQVGDVMPVVEQTVAKYLEKLSPEEREAQRDEIETQKQKMLQQLLRSAIDTKLLYLDFLRSLPADKRDELLPKITKRAEDEFYKSQLPKAIEDANAASAVELEAKLRRYGSSIEHQKRAFVERMLGQSVLAQSIDREPEVTHQEMRTYYEQHKKDYLRPARARWEKLTARFDRFPSKADAWAALGNMGNEVLRGAPLAAVARRHSQGVDADDGGYHDWTTQGSLASDVLDKAIFSLPIGQLSPRLEDERGFHIVRVIQRHEAGCVSFLEAQVEIKEKLRKKKLQQQINAYVARLKREIRVWTIFDSSSPNDHRT